MGKAKAKNGNAQVEFTPLADAALLRATAELLPHRQADGKRLKQWQLVAQRVALETKTAKGGDISTVGCMNRHKALLSIGRSQPKETWPGDEELHKLLEEAVEEDVLSLMRMPYSERLLKELLTRAKPRIAASHEAPVTSPRPPVTSEPVMKKSQKDDPSSSKKRKHRHGHDEREEKTPPSKASRSSPKPLILRLRRTPLAKNPEEGGETPQWRLVGPEPKKAARHHSSGIQKSPTKQSSSETVEKANKLKKSPPSPVTSKTASDTRPPRSESNTVSKSPQTAEAQASRTPQQTAESSKRKTFPEANGSSSTRVVSKPTPRHEDRRRPAPVSISPCSNVLATSTADGFIAGASSSTLNGPASPRHVFGDTVLVGELGRAQTTERIWLNVAEDTQPLPPNQVEADADQRDRETPPNEASRREINELKHLVKSMAVALAASQQEQAELRKMVSTSHVRATSDPSQPDLAQQVQILTSALNQAQQERNALHRGLIGLQQQATQLKSSEIKLQREVATLWQELTTLKGTQVLHSQAFEDVAKERCAIEASIEEMDRRHEAALAQLVDNEQLKREELVVEIEKGHAKHKSTTQAHEESLVWFQEEIKREVHELCDSMERDVSVYDDLLDKVQEEHKAQLESLNAKISALAKPSKHHAAAVAPNLSEELEELHEELETERHERQREYKALLRSIQRIVQ